MAKKLENYLRTRRHKIGLYQDDVAYLLGIGSSSVSEHEHYDRQPLLETVLAYRAVFGVPVATLFPGAYEKVEEVVRKRAHELIKVVELEEDGPAKRERLDALTAIADGLPSEHDTNIWGDITPRQKGTSNDS